MESEYYTLKLTFFTTIEGEDIENLMGSMEDVLGSMTGDTSMDMTGLIVEFKYAISKEGKMPEIPTDL